MANNEKATGWKIPLFFCCGILLAVATGHFFIARPEYADLLPHELVAQARARKIDLDSAEGKPWKEAILAAGGGFTPREIKDQRLKGVALQALAEERFDAACAAVILIKDKDGRDAVLEEIFKTACAECANLPWGVFALKAVSGESNALSMARALTERWNYCAGGK